VFVLELLLVDKWAAEAKAQVLLVVVLIEHRVDFSYVSSIHLYNMKFLGFQILNDHFWTIILPYVYCYKLFKAIKLGNNEGIFRLWSQQVDPFLGPLLSIQLNELIV
jgi:hypothetical protein